MPKQRTFSFVVPSAPDAVSARLKEQTRFQLVPGQGSILANNDQPLAGHVRGEGFRVALNRRDWWTLLQAVAVGRLTAEAGGTRIEGTAGLPTWMTWYLRFAFVAGLGVTGVGGWLAATGAEGGLPAFLPLLFGLVIVAMTAGIGLNVSNADAQVADLEAALREAAGAPSLDPEPQAEREDAAHRARAAAARRQREG